MGVYARKDSPFYWLLLERPGQKPLREGTRVPVHARTAAQRKEQRQLADAAYHTRMAQLARQHYELPGDTPSITFDWWAAWYLEHEVPKHRGAERERDIIALLRTAFGSKPLTALTRTRVTEWMTDRLAQPRVLQPTRPGGRPRPLPPVSPATVNREVDVLKAILQAAVTAGHLETSPLFGMKRLKGKKPKRRLLSEDEEERVLSQLEPADRALVIMGLDTLCRLGDILDLQWSDIHGTHLYIAHPKRGDPYTVPISKRLRKALKAIPRGESPYVFAHRRGARTDRDRRNSVRQMLETACRRANVPYGRNKGGVTFHWATRRTGASRMLARGADLPAVQRIGNWADPKLLLGIYAEAVPENVRRAVELVGKRAKKKPPVRQ